MKSAAYLVHGSDELLVSDKARELVDQLIPAERQAFSLETIFVQSDTVDAWAASLGQGIMALRTAGLFAHEKVVWIRGLTIPGTKKGAFESVTARLDQLSQVVDAGLPDGLQLVVSALLPVTYGPLIKAFGKRGTCCLFNVPEKRHEWKRAVQQKLSVWLAENSIKMDEEARLAFEMRVGGDSREVASELEKLKTYAGGSRQLSRADVLSVVSPSGDSAVWDLADAVAMRSLPQSLDLVRRLLFQKESTIGIIVILQSRIREMILLREAVDRKWLSPKGVWGSVPDGADHTYGAELQKDPRKTSPYFLRSRTEQALGFSRLQLLRCQDHLVKAHREMMAGALSDALVLETLVVKMLT